MPSAQVTSKDATQRDQYTNPEATELCVQLNRCGVCVCFAEGQYSEVCVFASTLCRYDLRRGNIFLLEEIVQPLVCRVFLDLVMLFRIAITLDFLYTLANHVARVSHPVFPPPHPPRDTF